jgi:hypothetical protein
VAEIATAVELDFWRDWSLVEGGPLRRLGRKLGLPRGRRGAVRLGLGVAALTWIPLLVANALEHHLTSGSTVPFLSSFGTHARLLVTIPLFFLAEALFDLRSLQAMRSLVASTLVPARESPRLVATLRTAARWQDSSIVEAGVVLIVIFIVVSGLRADLPAGLTTWRVNDAGGLTAAGRWYSLVSFPLFQFLLLGWVVRLLIWGWVLWRLARMRLNLLPTHPDSAGGLCPLGIAQVALAPLSFAVSAILVGTYAEEVRFGTVTVQQLVPTVVGVIVGVAVVMVLPLLFFVPKLLEVKQQGLIDYGELGERYVRGFDQKWIRGGAPPDESLLGSADVQSLADLANSFSIIDRMRLIPLSFRQFLVIVASAALPMTPLVLFILPLDELVTRIMKTFLNF